MSNNMYSFLPESKATPIIELIKDFRANIPDVKFGADFAMGRIVTNDGLEAIQTVLTADQLPAVGVYEETAVEEFIGIGEYIDEAGEELAIRFNALIAFDIWGINNYQRELANGLINNYFIQFRRKMRQLGFLQFKGRSTRVRGFDLTDRILQFHSHQITNILRKIIFSDVIYEVIVKEDKFRSYIRKIMVNSNINGNDEQYIVGDDEMPLPLLNDMRTEWNNTRTRW